MNQVALRRLIGGSVLVWVVCTVILMTHPVPPQQHVGAQEAPTVPPTASATAEAAPEQLARPLYLPLVLQGQGTAPDIPVNAAATARYVRCDWNNFDVTDVTGEPRVARVAFEKGYTAQSGAPLNDIILAFGRQVEPANPNVDGWGVQLTPPGSYSPCIGDNGIRDRDWVISVAEAYVEGYLANPAHRSGRIAIGTNNANFPWDCNNLGEAETLIHPLVCSPPLGAATPTGRWSTEGMSISFRFPRRNFRSLEASW